MSIGGGEILEPIEMAREIADVISDKQGEDIVILDTGKVSSIADYFLIATVKSERQAKAVLDDIDKKLKEYKKLPMSIDGVGTGWVLLDYGDVIVHIFDPGTRDFYNLEELWSNAPVVVRIQ